MGFNYKLPQSLHVVTVKRRLVIPVPVQLETNPNEGAYQYLSKNRKHYMQSLDGILLDWNTGKIRLKNKAVPPYFQARVAIKGEFTILRIQQGDRMTAHIIDQKPSAIVARTLENFLVYIEIPNDEIVFSPGDEVQFTFDCFDWEDMNPVIYGVNPVSINKTHHPVITNRNTEERQESVVQTVQQKRKVLDASPEPISRKKKRNECNPNDTNARILTNPNYMLQQRNESNQTNDDSNANNETSDTNKQRSKAQESSQRHESSKETARVQATSKASFESSERERESNKKKSLENKKRLKTKETENKKTVDESKETNRKSAEVKQTENETEINTDPEPDETGSGRTGSDETGSGETGNGKTGSGETGSGRTSSGDTAGDDTSGDVTIVEPEPIQIREVETILIDCDKIKEEIEIKPELTPASTPPPPIEITECTLNTSSFTPEFSRITTPNVSESETPWPYKSPRTIYHFPVGAPRRRLSISVKTPTKSSPSLMGQSERANDSSNLFESEVLIDLTNGEKQTSSTQSSTKSREKEEAPPGWTRRLHTCPGTGNKRKYYTYHSPLDGSFKSLKAAWEYHYTMMMQSDADQGNQTEMGLITQDSNSQIKIKDIKSLCNKSVLIGADDFARKLELILAGKNKLLVNSREGPTKVGKREHNSSDSVKRIGPSKGSQVKNVDEPLGDPDTEPRKHSLPKVIQGKDFMRLQNKKKKSDKIIKV